jgi:hypothetical protein
MQQILFVPVVCSWRTTDNTLLTSEKIGLIPAQRTCSLPPRGRQAMNEVSL